DALGFARLLGDLKTVHKPEIIFEATGVYSRRLQAFLEDNGYAYTRLNPLEAKKQLDSLRVRKTDQIDAEKLAQSQFVLNRKPTSLPKLAGSQPFLSESDRGHRSS
ncbi:transposase, partial [Streptococcus suis]|nr:transposase [Streptococcus suis]